MKKWAKAALGVAVLAGSVSTAQAFIIPQTDIVKFGQSVMEDVNRGLEYLKSTELYHALDQARSFDAQSRVDTFNNGAANMIARIQQQATDVFNLKQLENTKPLQNACDTISVQAGAAEALCAEGGILDTVYDKLGLVADSTLDSFKKAKDAVSSLVPSSIMADTPGAKASNDSESKKRWDKFIADEIAAVDKRKSWVDAGRGDEANDPSLLLVTSDIAPAYDTDQLAMAINMARLTYPPYVRENFQDPTNEREVAQDMKQKLALEGANAVIARQIALRTTEDPTKPSKLMALGMPVTIMFDDNGEIADNGEAWIHKVALNNNTTPGEVSKESLLMTGLKVNQAIESYKSQLIKEQMVLNIYMSKLEPSEKNQKANKG